MEQSIDEQLKDLKGYLAKHNQKLGLGQLVSSNETNRYLTMSQGEIQRMTAQECGTAAVILSQAAAFIQSENNREQAIARWCKQVITKAIAGEITQVGTQYLPYEYRRELAIAQDDFTEEVYAIQRVAESRVDNMAYMSSSLRNLASVFESLQQTKRGMRS
jgi:hypothetical protein